MSATAITPYLFFSGRCEEALKFYEQALGAKTELIMRFNESPDPVPEGMLQPGFEAKIMHCSFTIDGVRIMAADGCNDKAKMEGIQLALSVATEAEAHKAFGAFSVDGSVGMPLTKTFWSPCFGMVTDRFNVTWMVMVPGEPIA